MMQTDVKGKDCVANATTTVFDGRARFKGIWYSSSGATSIAVKDGATTLFTFIIAGGLNAKGRASYNAANPGKPGLKRPQPEGGKRRDSFCARMKGMKAKLTSAKTANDPDSRINKSLRAWNCKDGGYVTAADGCATKGKTKGRMV